MRVPMRHARGTYYCILLALDFALHLNISTNDKHINPVPLMRSYNRCRFEVSIKGAWCLLFTTCLKTHNHNPLFFPFIVGTPSSRG